MDAVFHRRDAIYPATVVGKPRQEDFFIGDYLQQLLSPLFPLVMPGVRDLWTYGETGFHSLCAAVVQERYGREALVSGFRILGEGQLSLTKFLLLTDTPQDLHDFPRLLEHVLARFNPETDLFIFSNVSMDTLDYTSGKVNEGSKAIMLGLGALSRCRPCHHPRSTRRRLRDTLANSYILSRRPQDRQIRHHLLWPASHRWRYRSSRFQLAESSASPTSPISKSFYRTPPAPFCVRRRRQRLGNPRRPRPSS